MTITTTESVEGSSLPIDGRNTSEAGVDASHPVLRVLKENTDKLFRVNLGLKNLSKTHRVTNIERLKAYSFLLEPLAKALPFPVGLDGLREIFGAEDVGPEMHIPLLTLITLAYATGEKNPDGKPIYPDWQKFAEKYINRGSEYSPITLPESRDDFIHVMARVRGVEAIADQARSASDNSSEYLEKVIDDAIANAIDKSATILKFYLQGWAERQELKQ